MEVGHESYRNARRRGPRLSGNFLHYRTEETVLDVGPVEASVEETNTLPLPAVAGGIALVAGVVLIFIGRKGV